MKWCACGEKEGLWIDNWKKMVKIEHEGNPSYFDFVSFGGVPF